MATSGIKFKKLRGRPSAERIIIEVQDCCRKAGIDAHELKLLTGYNGAYKLLAGDLMTLTHNTEALLRLWLDEMTPVEAEALGQPEEVQLELDLTPMEEENAALRAELSVVYAKLSKEYAQ